MRLRIVRVQAFAVVGLTMHDGKYGHVKDEQQFPGIYATEKDAEDVARWLYRTCQPTSRADAVSESGEEDYDDGHQNESANQGLAGQVQDRQGDKGKGKKRKEPRGIRGKRRGKG